MAWRDQGVSVWRRAGGGGWVGEGGLALLFVYSRV